MWIFPFVDPVAFSVFGWPVRWYGLMYMLGIWLGWLYVRSVAYRSSRGMCKEIDDFLPWCVMGVVLGGRLGYVLFYDLSYFLENPALIWQTWRGGMSFHGGLLGVAFSFMLFAWKRGLSLALLTDFCVMGVPIGLFFGRIGNLINQEAYGRITDVPWAIIFPEIDGYPRHPSQIYEAFLEGLLLFIVLRVFAKHLLVKPWAITGLFLLSYGVVRWFAELYRVPDALIYFYGIHLTIGQVLSLPMMMVGGGVLWWRLRTR